MPWVNAKLAFFQNVAHPTTLHTLIDKYVHQNKGKLLACFIDFKKAFDSIWHEGLYLKLINSGIGGKCYDLIKSMYTASQCAVKIGNQRTEFFPQGRGVRQGCSLSLTLFNIYINQLANILEHAPIQGLTLHEIKCVFSMKMTWSSCRPLKRGFRTACICWRISVSPGPWWSTSKKHRVMIFQKCSRS